MIPRRHAVGFTARDAGGRLDGQDNGVETLAVSVHDDVPPDGLRNGEAMARSDHHTFTQNVADVVSRRSS